MNGPSLNVVSHTVPLSELSPFMLACMDEGLSVTITVNGTSMTPYLHNRKDAAVLKKPADASALQVGDVPLYLRDNGQYVLHRVAAVQADGCYTMLGDNQSVREPDIRPDQILAVSCGFYRGKKYTHCDSESFRRHARRWLNSRFYRRFFRLADRLFRKDG